MHPMWFLVIFQPTPASFFSIEILLHGSFFSFTEQPAPPWPGPRVAFPPAQGDDPWEVDDVQPSNTRLGRCSTNKNAPPSLPVRNGWSMMVWLKEKPRWRIVFFSRCPGAKSWGVSTGMVAGKKRVRGWWRLGLLGGLRIRGEQRFRCDTTNETFLSLLILLQGRVWMLALGWLQLSSFLPKRAARQGSKVISKQIPISMVGWIPWHSFCCVLARGGCEKQDKMDSNQKGLPLDFETFIHHKMIFLHQKTPLFSKFSHHANSIHPNFSSPHIPSAPAHSAARCLEGVVTCGSGPGWGPWLSTVPSV